MIPLDLRGRGWGGVLNGNLPKSNTILLRSTKKAPEKGAFFVD